MKTCPKCKEEKDFKDFYKDNRNKTKTSPYCKICSKAWSCAWYKKSQRYRDSIRSGGLKHRFGISLDDYCRMAEDQNYVCAICKTKTDKNLHVDHDHETGNIRELLCKNCNHGLGNFKDNKEFLHQAISYLERHERNFSAIL